MKSLAHHLEEIYRSHRRQLYACALAIVRCPDKAEDAVHAAFARLFALRSAPDNLRAYAFRAVRNAAIDAVRISGSASAPWPDSETVPVFDMRPSAFESLAEAEDARAVTSELDLLTGDERETIIMHIHAGLTFREIAAIMERSQSTVASWYRRGIARLRERLEREPCETPKIS